MIGWWLFVFKGPVFEYHVALVGRNTEYPDITTFARQENLQSNITSQFKSRSKQPCNEQDSSSLPLALEIIINTFIEIPRPLGHQGPNICYNTGPGN